MGAPYERDPCPAIPPEGYQHPILAHPFLSTYLESDLEFCQACQNARPALRTPPTTTPSSMATQRTCPALAVTSTSTSVLRWHTSVRHRILSASHQARRGTRVQQPRRGAAQERSCRTPSSRLSSRRHLTSHRRQSDRQHPLAPVASMTRTTGLNRLRLNSRPRRQPGGQRCHSPRHEACPHHAGTTTAPSPPWSSC
jgi:hypothetical protein